MIRGFGPGSLGFLFFHPMNRAEYNIHTVLSVTDVTPTTFVLRMTRQGLDFLTGQHINVGVANSGVTREYSVYSGEEDDYLEVLVKHVIDGLVTPHLHGLKPGDKVMIEPAIGYFQLPNPLPQKSILLIATGTGIAPYHSFIKTYPNLNYTLLHGSTTPDETIQPGHYNGNYQLCTSRSDKGHFAGRVTDWLRQNALDDYSNIYLCGNRNMINEAIAILAEKNYPSKNIHFEAYF